MKRLPLFLIAACIVSTAGAQNAGPMNIRLQGKPECGFDKVLQKLNVSHNVLIDAYRVKPRPEGAGAKSTGIVYDIPVVFHLVYNQASLNLPDSVINNQLGILNKAFRKQHADTANTRAIFKPLSGDAEIQFHLATLDPQGNPTTGITRTLSPRTYFGTATGNLDSLERVKKTTLGGIDPWPTNRYLNIWVTNLSDAIGQLGVLGYAIPPLNPLPSNWPAGADAGLGNLTDGVVLQTHSVGSNSTLNAALQGIYSKGRCAVHEVGHYLGLMHVFGSNGANGGSCGATADDGINDTPEQSTASFDAQSGTSCPPATKNSCGAGTAGDLPDMWENYMDYARDACQTMFTFDQIAVIRNVMANQRNSLVPATTSVNHLAGKKELSIYPNPASNTLSIIYDGKIDKASIVNIMGQQLLSAQVPDSKTYDISNIPAGNYLLILQAEGQKIIRKFSVIK